MSHNSNFLCNLIHHVIDSKYNAFNPNSQIFTNNYDINTIQKTDIFLTDNTKLKNTIPDITARDCGDVVVADDAAE